MKRKLCPIKRLQALEAVEWTISGDCDRDEITVSITHPYRIQESGRTLNAAVGRAIRQYKYIDKNYEGMSYG